MEALFIEKKQNLEDEDILVMSGTKLRHKYFAIKILKEVPRTVAIMEESPEDISRGYVKEPSITIREHFNSFVKTEKKYFESYIKNNKDILESKLIKKIENKKINQKENIDYIKKLNPKLISVHSTSLISEDLINEFPKRIINLHAGLSPYYRGSGTNVWPFYIKELEYVGMTIHYIDKVIDSGDIILQGRPKFEIGDNTHSIGCKNIILGTDLMIKVIRKYLEKGKLPSVKQNKKKGRLYLKKEFNDEVVKTINKYIDEGLISEYIKNPKEVELVQW